MTAYHFTEKFQNIYVGAFEAETEREAKELFANSKNFETVAEAYEGGAFEDIIIVSSEDYGATDIADDIVDGMSGGTPDGVLGWLESDDFVGAAINAFDIYSEGAKWAPVVNAGVDREEVILALESAIRVAVEDELIHKLDDVDDLDELLKVLKHVVEIEKRTAVRFERIDYTSLTEFSGDDRKVGDTAGIFSWDDDRLLVQDDVEGWKLVARQD